MKSTCVRVDLIDEVEPVGQDELLQVPVQAELHNHIQLSYTTREPFIIHSRIIHSMISLSILFDIMVNCFVY